jgi:hypothetical protein
MTAEGEVGFTVLGPPGPVGDVPGRTSGSDGSLDGTRMYPELGSASPAAAPSQGRRIECDSASSALLARREGVEPVGCVCWVTPCDQRVLPRSKNAGRTSPEPCPLRACPCL